MAWTRQQQPPTEEGKKRWAEVLAWIQAPPGMGRVVTRVSDEMAAFDALAAMSPG